MFTPLWVKGRGSHSIIFFFLLFYVYYYFFFSLVAPKGRLPKLKGFWDLPPTGPIYPNGVVQTTGYDVD